MEKDVQNLELITSDKVVKITPERENTESTQNSETLEIRKPEAETSGFTGISKDTTTGNGHILAEPQFLYNSGTAMSEEKNINDNEIDEKKAEITEKEKSETSLKPISDKSDTVRTSTPHTVSDSGFSRKPEFGMSNGFIKLQRDAEELLELDPDAFLLLTQIAFRARRRTTKYQRDNLSINQALIGDFKSIGLTEQRYRSAKDRIEQKYRLATFKATNKGTIATLCNCDIYDINCESDNEPATSQQRASNEQITTNKEVKEVKEVKKKNTSYSKRNGSGEPSQPPSADAAELLGFFISSLEMHIPEVANPKSMQHKINCKTFDTLLKGGYSPDEVKRVVTFSHTDPFWSQHIHTPKKLKEKFSQLMAKMRRDMPVSHSPKPTVDRRQRDSDGLPIEYEGLPF